MFNPAIRLHHVPAENRPVEQHEAPDSLGIRAYAAYARAISYLITGFRACGLFLISSALGTILLEPISALRAACEGVYYGIIRRSYAFSGINPRELNEEKRHTRPVLFLHSNYHSPAACTAIASTLRQGQYTPHIFTVSLSCGALNQADHDAVNEKMQEIRDLYGDQRLSIDLVGHARGADLARRFANRDAVNRIVVLGNSGENHEKICEINGRFDYLMPDAEIEVAAQRAVEAADSHKIIRTEGHLGLLYSADVHDEIIRWLQPTSQLEAPAEVDAPEEAPAGQRASERRLSIEPPVIESSNSDSDDE